MDDNEYRLYLIWRTDIEIPYDKGLIQAGHAFTNVLIKARRNNWPPVIDYESSEFHPKIVLNGKNIAAMTRLQQELNTTSIPWYQVTDAGRTVFSEPTITCMAVGPMRRSDMTPFMKRLQLLRSVNPRLTASPIVP